MLNQSLMQKNDLTNVSRISVTGEQNSSNETAVPYFNELILVRQLTQTWLVPLIVLIGMCMHNFILTRVIFITFC